MHLHTDRTWSRCPARPAHFETCLQTVALAALAIPIPGQQLFAELGKSHLPTDSAWTESIALGDVDADGNLDVVCGNARRGQNRLYLGDGTGRFVDGTATRMPADADETLRVALGDLDSDGDLDLVLGNDGSDRLYLNDGTGTFTDASGRLPSRTERTTALGLGDVDGDGDLDLVLGARNAQNRLYLNDGHGNFNDETRARMPSRTDRTNAMVLADVDGDGDVDLIQANEFQQNRLYVNDGRGSFTDESAVRMPADANRGAYGLAVMDVDGDGDPDLVFGNSGPNSLYINQGNGMFVDETSTRVPSDGSISRSLAHGDVDGDGDLDFIAGKVFRPNRLYLNDGSGIFSYASFGDFPSGNEATMDVALGDVDGDGDLDLVEGDRTHRNGLFLNDAAGHFVDATRPKLARNMVSAFSMEFGDVDRDGDLDLLCSGNGYPTRLFLNDATGWLRDVTFHRMPTVADRTNDLTLGDVDGDGDLDVVQANSREQDRLYLNDGSGRFIDSTNARLPQRSESSSGVALGDIDGDGDLDLAVASPLVGTRLLVNDGNGRFADRPPSLAAPGETRAVLFVDVDRDGDLDLVTTYYLAQDRLYLNDGAGNFTDATAARMPVDAAPTIAVTSGDVDEDGDLDLIFGSRNAQNRLYLNDGTGRFVDLTATRLPPDTGSSDTIVACDLEGDGDLDLFVGNRTGQHTVLVNDGAGTFVDRTTSFLPNDVGNSTSVALGDIDGDGDPDLALADPSGGRVLTNLQRQLDAPFLLQPGRPYSLYCFAHPARPGAPAPAVALPFVAAGAARIRLGSLGVFRLDPATLVPLPLTPIPADGRPGVSTVSVPNDPALVGRSFHAQALILQQPGLSGLTGALFDVAFR